RVRDFAEVRLEGVVTAAAAERALELLEVDERGLDRLDREILRTICEKFEGGPVGLSTLAIAVGEERDTLEDVYEPYLLTEGLIKRTPRGRAGTPAAFAHPGLDAACFVCDGEGRVVGCGKNSFAFTGLEEEHVIGQRVEEVLGLQFATGDAPVTTVHEWGVRALEVPVRVCGERDVAADAK